MNLLSLDIRMLRSLISVVDTGSITETARRLGRTQPAISLQIQRLEDITGKVLFHHEGRRMQLTPDGDMVLAYAKSILRLHDELLSRLSSPEVQGHVVLGTPDLYAAYMLPSILALFKKTFPRIQVELRCALSTPTVDRVQKGEVDIALVTRMNNFTGGLVVHQEQLVWIVGEHSRAQYEDPVRLALLPPGNIYREHAIEHIERAGRKWQIACVSESVGGLQAAVFAGMAITVLGRCALVTGMRELTSSRRFPAAAQGRPVALQGARSVFTCSRCSARLSRPLRRIVRRRRWRGAKVGAQAAERTGAERGRPTPCFSRIAFEVASPRRSSKRDRGRAKHRPRAALVRARRRRQV